MVGTVRIEYTRSMQQKHAVLDEIIERTRDTAQETGVDFIIQFDERQGAYIDEAEDAFAVGHFESLDSDHYNHYAITVSNRAQTTLSDLALKGLIYHMMGIVFGEKEIEKRQRTGEYVGSLLERMQAPGCATVKEAYLDAKMLQYGGTTEALIAYKVETMIDVVRRMSVREGARDKEISCTRKKFTHYCDALNATLLASQSQPGDAIKLLTLTRLRQDLPAVARVYEN